MLKLGLTGGIASGKSAVGEMFVKLGAHLIQADAVAHWLMEPGRPVYEEVVRRFGREILNPDGTSTVRAWPKPHLALRPALRLALPAARLRASRNSTKLSIPR